MTSKSKFLALGFVGALATSGVAAAPVTWTDWTRISANTAVGTMGGVTVIASSGEVAMDGVSQTGCDPGAINYWTEPDPSRPAYTGGSIDNAPTACEQVGLSSAVEVTVTFSAPVTNLYMALLSVGQPNYTVTYDFDRSFTVDSAGVGYWSFANGGNPGPYSLGAGDTISMQEFHGVLAFSGAVTSLTFSTDPNEFWHAFTFGTAQVPEPGTLALLGLGLGVLTLVRRRR